nr:tripartite tricarboxylate transporter substrate-binding protein [Roseospira navarrensis]
MAAGGVDIAVASLPEAAALMDAGLVRPLAVFAETRQAGAPAVPTFAEATGHAFTLGTWRGVVAPKGLPAAVADSLTRAVEAAVRHPDTLSFLRARGYDARWVPGADFAAFMRESDATLAESLRAVGLAR